MVECFALNPCWCSICGMFCVICGSIIFSNILAIADRRAIGRKLVPMFLFLLGLGIGMIFASFQRWGIVFVLIAMLKICVRYVIALGPKCLRCLMLMLSGPVELLVFACFIACLVCVSVISMIVFCSL